jgi:phosphohistidine swiveling domain-containing protein
MLEIIAKYGNRKNISRKELTSLNISNFLNSRTDKDIKNLKKLSKKNLKDYLINKKIKLPLLIQDLSNIRVIPYQVSSPNFITHKKVKGQVLLNPDLTKTKNLTNKIILIENADPGYDWIFGYEILGLITKYGGINSHMSIRCSELSIPAVIGCGEEIFSNLINNRSIYLDCSSSVIYSI